MILIVITIMEANHVRLYKAYIHCNIQSSDNSLDSLIAPDFLYKVLGNGAIVVP